MENEKGLTLKDLEQVEKLAREIRLNFETILGIIAKGKNLTANGLDVFNQADILTATALRVLQRELDENKVERPIRMM